MRWMAVDEVGRQSTSDDLPDMTTFIFPTNGNALTAIKSSVLDPDPSLPPPRKAPKIEARPQFTLQETLIASAPSVL
jgi:hypothetical protein